jgi:UDP-glucose 4-epimerase
MRIVMTGVSSYLAQVLLPLLEADPDTKEIIGVDLKAPGPEFKKVRFVRRDVRDSSLFQDFASADTLIHLAFIVMPLRDMAEANSINIQGSINSFEAAAKAGLRKIVQASSIAAYGAWPDNPELITEDVPVRGMPDFYYSWTKAEVEKYLDKFEKDHPEIIITRLRPCIFVGPKINNIFRDIATQRFFFRFSGLETRFQLVWDEDVAQAFYKVTKEDFPGAFNIAGDNPLDVNEIPQLIGLRAIRIPFSWAKSLAKVGWALHLSKMLSPGWLDVTQFPIIVDCSKAKTILGWKPKYDTAGAMLKLLEYKEEFKKGS